MPGRWVLLSLLLATPYIAGATLPLVRLLMAIRGFLQARELGCGMIGHLSTLLAFRQLFERHSSRTLMVLLRFPCQ